MGVTTKHDVLKSVAEKNGITVASAERIIGSLFDEIKAGLSNGDKVVFRNFGTFELRGRSARQGRDFQTGEVVEIPSTLIISFRPGTELRESVLGGK